MEWIDKIKEYLSSDDVWVLKIFIIVFLTLLLNYIVKKVLSRVESRLDKTSTVWDDAIIKSIRGPIAFLIWVLGLTLASRYIQFQYADVVQTVCVIFVIAWALVRFIKQVELNIISRNEKLGEKIDRTTADAIAQLLRVSVVITALLVMLQSLGFNISAILAFGGIGGIAVGFAAKDLLANFFGGLMIYLDRPFAVGDWVRSPDRNIEGTVEKIGWRLTIIRTFDKRPLYIPNSVFATIAVENPSRMTNRRIYETIGVRYDDIQNLDAIIKDVRSMLEKHPDIESNLTMIVNFNEFSASSLDFFVYTFTKTTDWIEFHNIKQDVLLKISAIIESYGAEIAFPTSTIHLEGQLPENEPLPVKQ